MSTLNSTSTLAEIEAAVADNVSYAEDGSAAKARAFIQACRLLLIKRPSAMGAPGSVTFGDQAQLQRLLDDAQRWLESQQAGGRVRHLDFRNVRS